MEYSDIFKSRSSIQSEVLMLFRPDANYHTKEGYFRDSIK